MKFLLLLLTAATVFSSGAQTDSDWKNASADFCKGINKASRKISADTKEAIIFSGETGADLSEIFADLITENADKFLKDVEAMQEMALKIEKLSVKLEKKYDGVFDSVDEIDMNMHYLTILKDQKECAFARALIQVAMQSPGDDEPPMEE